MEQIKSLKNNDNFWLFLAVITTIFISWPLLGAYLCSPNQLMFAYTGDPLVLYYNAVWNVAYDHSDKLGNMNYPDGELIFLTDAQGALVTLLRWINGVIPIKDYVVGIINSVNIFGVYISAALYYLILRNGGVSMQRAWILAPFIVLLSPQLPRIVPHHGLGNLAILPLCILWFIRKHRLQKPEKRDLGMWLILLFCCFNNPYIGFMSTTFLTLAFLVSMAWKKKWSSWSGGWSALSISPLVILFFYFKIQDHAALDRLQLQWGFFFYRANFEGLFFSPNSVMGHAIQIIFKNGFKIQEEANIALYFLLTLVILISFFTFLVKRSSRQWFKLPSGLSLALISSICIFLYASAIIFIPFSHEFVEEKLGPLLMFKAVARLAWPFWNMLMIIAIIYLHRFLDELPSQGVKIILPIVIFSFYVEHKYRIGDIFQQYKHENMFSKEKVAELNAYLESTNVKFEQYQAMLLLPKTMAWNDNFLSDLSYHAQGNGMRISYAKQIPLISGMLSRYPVSQMAERIGFLGHPLIKKSLQDKFKDKRKILILVGKDIPLQYGEQALVNQSKKLFENQDISLHELDPFSVNENPELSHASEDFPADSMNTPDILREGFDKEVSTISYYGNGSKKVPGGLHELASFTMSSVMDSSYMFSAWIHIDSKRYGVGYWELSLCDANGKEKQRLTHEIRRSNDIHGDWIRSEILFHPVPGDVVKIYLNAQRELIADEILIRPLGKHTILQSDKHQRLFDGFRIDLTKK